MWLGTRAGEARRFAIWATASLGAFLLVGPQLSAQGTPAGSQIRNWATLAYTSSGFGYVMPSDTVDLVVAQLAGVGLQAPQSSGASPGTAVVFAHTLSNLGNGPDSFSVAATSAHAWPLTLYRDVNSNGILDGGDSALTGPVALASGSTAALLVQIAIPASGSAGVTDTITVIATSGFDGAVSGSVRDLLSVSSAPIAFSVTKQVDRATAAVGDVLTYTLDYVAAGTDSASAVQLADTIPVGASYVAGTIRFNGILQTDAADGDAGRLVASGNGVVAVSLGTVAAGSAGSVTFQARVNSGAPATVLNRGNLAFTWSGGSDTTVSNAVQTTILAPALSLSKQLTSPAVALVGQQVQYRLRYGNAAGAGTAQSVVLTDTLPQGLQYVSATAAPAIAGQVLTWSLGTLAPADSGVIDLVLVVAATVRDTVVALNVAYIQGQGTTAVAATAPQVALVGPPTAALGLDLAADALEVGVGEAIPYTTTVRNPGTLTVTDLQIAVQLPVGARYVAGSVIGADSGVVAGGRLVLYSAAPLAPGTSRTLRYVAALISAPGTVAEARAVATGQVTGGLAGSPEAIAWVQIRRAWPMETRAAIGKVWVDANGDGRQGAGEGGLANVDIWTEDGMVATTDSTGKFSFTNVRPGRHAFRLDPRSIPDGYRLATEDIQLVDASGWTTPRVDFRLVATSARAGVATQPAPGANARDRHTLADAAPNARIGASRQTVEFSFAAVRLPDTAASKGLAFQHELPTPYRPMVRYDVSIRQSHGVALDAVVVFSPRADSAVVYVDGVQFTKYSWLERAIPIPFARPGAEIRIAAWSSERRDSAAVHVVAWPPHAGENATQRRYAGRTESSVRAPVRSAPTPVYAAVPVPEFTEQTTPPVSAAAPAPASVPADSSRPSIPPFEDTVVVAHARGGPKGQAAEQLVAAVRGPGVEIFTPSDGAVLSADRVYVGVKGEPSVRVVLYDGATPLDTARTRIDGVFDFIAVPLARGPHRLRVAVQNSWGQERWDSVAVHVTGLPARFQISQDARSLMLVADGRSTAVVNVRVVDGWGVPVAQPAYVTVRAKGAEPRGADADASSVGLQLLSTAAGRLAIELRPGRVVGPGELELKSGDATATVPLELLPEVRGLTVAGSGLVGAGAAPDAYGALTARGRLDSRTSFTLGLDSRRLNDGRNAFDRSADPLEESQYPILGDASAQQKRTASQTWLSARLERGYDWATFGDLSTSGFASGLSLAQYRRAVTGVAAHVTTGPLTWSAFGSLTAQALRQLQLRGAGISGPYQLAADMVPGTEYVRVETRDRANPERAVATQALVRFVDYQIDYTGGVVLFKQPIPATDADGNPVFITVTFEAASGAEQHLVAGARAALDVRQLVGDGLRLDSLRIGVTAVNAEQAINRYRLIGGDVRLFRTGALDVGGEVAYAELGDSTGLATSAKASYSLFGGTLTFGASYMHVGREFTNPSNVALQPGLAEASLRTGLKLGATELRAEHSHEEFALQGVDREHTRVGIVQRLGAGLQVDGGVASDHVSGASMAPSDVTAADLRAKWSASPKFQIWTEARRHLSLSGPELSPELWGVGASYQVAPTLSLEASERYVSRPDSQKQYSVTSFGMRADMGHGTQAWGSYQLTGGVSGAGNAAIIGLRNRMQITPDLAVNVLFERRQGVGRASVADPVRALPFLQTEADYWSAGAGLELLPKGAPYRLTARGEYKDGTLQSTRLATVAGDVAFASSLALLTRQEYSQNALPGVPLSRRLSSLWGLALRPAHTDRLNILAKFQWSDDRNPVGGGVLVARGEERKAIGAAELIWTLRPALELSTRYAVRRTEAARLYPDGTPQTLTAWADYVGGRVNLDLNPWVSLRSDGRLLMERTTGATAWDGAPAVVLHPVAALEIATGYRFGNLSDPDFSVRGGHGAFVTLAVAVTEKLFPTAAAFWRSRF
ncbi:MAG TPA: SdrD B-like domain-containing protein [Gemmatimonadales bacterium]|nr:SdrD B-like domain-containing protein [Gemmatimonadales bacterium]